MVSKAKSIKGSAKGIAYIQSDKELGPALELDRNGIVSEDPSGILQEFRLFQEANQKCDKNMISIVISPSDERAFTNEELRDIGKHHLESGLDFKASEIKKGFGMNDLILHQVKMPELSKPYQDIANSLSKLTSRGMDPTLLNPALNIGKQIAETVIKKTISKGLGMGM